MIDSSMILAAQEADLFAARQQMALSLGWHIIVAALGVGFPILILIAEWRGQRTGNADYTTLAQRWSKHFGVLFAVGAVSGTILSFEMGILWPGLMGRYGDVIGLPFALEGFAFFIEAIFLGIYLYGWDRLSPKAHLLSGIPVAIAGTASAWFVVTANAWMNQPTGFSLKNGQVVDVDPIAAIFNPATPVQTTHMILAAYMVSGFAVAAVHAWAMLRGRKNELHRLGLIIALSFAAIFAPIQILVGDWAARFLAENQPVKLAAIEAQYETERGAPLHIGGIVIDGELRYAIEIPKALSLLAKGDANAEITGLNSTAPRDRPPVAVVRMAFQVMVAIGFGLLGLSLWFFIVWLRRRQLPSSRKFLWGAVIAGPAAVIAMEAGWITTEVGRQPWIVYGIMRVDEAVTQAPHIRYGYYALVVVYAVLTVATIAVLRRVGQSFAGDDVAPQTPEVPRTGGDA